MIEHGGAILIRLIGSFVGAFLALIWQPPKTLNEFWTRGIFSVISGALWGDRLREWAHWPKEIEPSIAAAALTALLSWWAMAMAVRIIGSWKQK